MSKSQLIRNRNVKRSNSHAMIRMLEASVRAQELQGCAGMDEHGFPAYMHRSDRGIVRCAVGVLMSRSFRYNDRTMFGEISSVPLKLMFKDIAKKFGYRAESVTETERLRDMLQRLQDSHDMTFEGHRFWPDAFIKWRRDVNLQIQELEEQV